jgi:hypothetical protein
MTMTIIERRERLCGMRCRARALYRDIKTRPGWTGVTLSLGHTCVNYRPRPICTSTTRLAALVTHR